MRRPLLPVLLLAACGACAQPPAVAVPSTPPTLAPTPARAPRAALQQDILDAIQSDGVRRGTWAILVESLDRQDRVFELNPRALLVPASVAKLVATASAVETVGWDFRYETLVRTNGRVENGTLRGDLFVVGAGDPTIGGRGGDGLSSWVDALLAAGIRRIDGRVIGDDNAIEEPRPQLAWAWDDLGYTSGAIYGALNLEENRMAVTVTPAAVVDGPTRLSVDPATAARPLTNRTVTGPAGSPAFIWPEQRPGEAALTIAGSLPAGGAAARLNVAAGNPTYWFASVLRNRLQSAGIEVTGEAFDIDDLTGALAPPTTTLHVHRSATLAEIAQPMLKESINLYAEAVLRLNAEPGALPTNDAALAGLRTHLSSWGVPDDAQQIMDGSGLSRRAVIAAELLMTVLRRMYDASGASPWMHALPVAGVDGSLSGRMRGTAAEGNVRAKTGTMSNIRSLAGYVTTADGEHLAFVIMVNNFEGSGTAALQAIDRIAVRLATSSR